MSFNCEIFKDLHILNKCVNNENRAVQSNTSSQLQKLSIYTKRRPPRLSLLRNYKESAPEGKLQFDLIELAPKKSSEFHHTRRVFFLYPWQDVRLLPPLNIELVHCLKLQQPHVVGGGLCTVCSVQPRQRQPFHGPAAAPAFLTKNRPFRWQPVSLFHQPVEHVMLGVGELGSTL